MGVRNRRKLDRLNLQFQTMLSQMGLSTPFERVSENLSQGGVFVKTGHWPDFKINDKAVIDFLLPPGFTGLNETIGLSGTALVVRIDRESEGIGLRFTENLRYFTGSKSVSGHKYFEYQLCFPL